MGRRSDELFYEVVTLARRGDDSKQLNVLAESKIVNEVINVARVLLGMASP